MNKAEHNEMWAKAARKWRERDRELAGWGGATTWSSYVHGEALGRAKKLEAGRRSVHVRETHGSKGRSMNAVELVAALRDLYRRRPETRHLQAWELPWMLYALNYSDELEDEAEIAAAIEVASGDHPGWRPAA